MNTNVYELFKMASSHKFSTESVLFCKKFLQKNGTPKYVLGRNVYTRALCKIIPLDGVIDDFTNASLFCDIPIVKMINIPKNAMVINAAGGRTIQAKKRLDSLGVQNIDYFKFLKITRLKLPNIVFNENFDNEFLSNISRYQWLFDIIQDKYSLLLLYNLLLFRLTYDLAFLESIYIDPSKQYFEDFLKISHFGEVFVDAGGFKGETSIYFASNYPNYRSIHLFEPNTDNYLECTKNLQKYPNIHCYPVGLYNKQKHSCFSNKESASHVSDYGDTIVKLDLLDNILTEDPTYIKMDIEGSEINALQGSRKIIKRSKCKLAVSAYHRPGDYWKIPDLILSLHDKYEIKIRHYSESIYETVMYFLPK
ncbi:MAG: FkbM family methyltransferase [Hydrogenophilus thermoluteolus]